MISFFATIFVRFLHGLNIPWRNLERASYPFLIVWKPGAMKIYLHNQMEIVNPWLLDKNINQNMQEEQHETINIIKPDKRRKLFWFLLCD